MDLGFMLEFFSGKVTLVDVINSIDLKYIEGKISLLKLVKRLILVKMAMKLEHTNPNVNGRAFKAMQKVLKKKVQLWLKKSTIKTDVLKIIENL